MAMMLITIASFLLLSFSSIAISQPSPHALFAPLTLGPRSNLYVTPISIKTPLQQASLLLDLDSDYLWVLCNAKYRSSTFRPVRCGTPTCAAAGSSSCGDCYGPPAPGCNNNTCGITISNSFIDTFTPGELSQDTIAIRSTDGKSAGSLITLNNFALGCGTDLLLQNGSVPAGVTGVAGLSRQRLSLPTQLAQAKGFSRKFAYCLPSSRGTGVIFFGDGPYVFPPAVDASTQLRFVPLLPNRGFPDQYYIGVKDILVDGKKISFDSTSLKITKDGTGGTRITSTTYYTTLARPIYIALRDAFVKAAAARGIKRVSAVRPFDACFDSTTAKVTSLGYLVPEIGLSIQGSQGSGRMLWQIFGANSVVSVSNKVFCLAFQDAGPEPFVGIKVGTYQQQDHLLQFDLVNSRLGFTPSLLGSQTTCSNFKFTSSSP